MIRTVVLAMAVGLLAHVAAAQEPPIKMGLWETSTTTTTKVPPQMPALASMGGTATDKRVACFSAGDWQRAMGLMKDGMGCTTTQRPTAHGMSMDLMCKNDATNTVARMDVVFDAMVKMTSTMHSTMTAPSMGKGEVTMDIKSESHFVSADCGEVKPGTSVQKD
jgi:hypothetical protein